MRVLFIGGTGLISSAVSPLVVERGHDLTLVTRGTSPRPPPPRALPPSWPMSTTPRHSVRPSRPTWRRTAGTTSWCSGSASRPDHISDDIDTFDGLTDQYVFISSASAYAHATRALHRARGLHAPPQPVLAVQQGQGRVGAPAARRLRRARLPVHRGAALAHLRLRGRADGDQLVGAPVDHGGSPAARQEDADAGRRHQPVDADGPPRLRLRLRGPLGQQRRDRRGVSHHLGRRAQLEPDPRRSWRAPWTSARTVARPDAVHPQRDARALRPGGLRGSAPWRQGERGHLRQLQGEVAGARLRAAAPLRAVDPRVHRVVHGASPSVAPSTRKRTRCGTTSPSATSAAWRRCSRSDLRADAVRAGR